MLEQATTAVKRDRPVALYSAIDERSRFAMDSIVADRTKAATLIRRDYPKQTQARALLQLGDAAFAKDAAALFVKRCDQACRAGFDFNNETVASVKTVGELTVVTTDKGRAIKAFAPPKARTGYGLVWRTQELSKERDDANRDLRMIVKNAEIYRQRKALER